MLLFGCSKRESLWRVAIVGSPVRITPSDANLLPTSYILKQTHEPIFNKDKNGSFYSNILDHWGRSIDYKDFRLCIAEPRYFGEGEYFTFSLLKDLVLRSLQAFKENHYKYEADNNCLTLHFNTAFPDFLTLLSSLENAPSRKSKIANVENGLGDFIVENFSKELVTLKRKREDASKIDQINFYNIEFIEHDRELMGKMDDINHLLAKSLATIPKEKFKAFEYSPLREFVLLINVRDEKIRESIFNCVNIDLLRKSAYLDEKQFNDVSTLFPVGIRGGKPGKLYRKCNLELTSSRNATRQIDFKIWEGVDVNGIENAFANVHINGKKVPIIVHRKKYVNLIEDMIAKKFDLALMVVDTRESSYHSFFDYIYDNNQTLVNPSGKEGYSLYNQLKNKSDLKDQYVISLKLQQIVFSEHIVLPIFQPVRTFYYPKNVSGLYMLEDFLDFPNLSRIEL